MDNYKVIESKLKELAPFRGNTMRGEYDERGNYRVFSYAMEIGVWYVLADGKVINPEQRSVTTSKHQSILARAWGFPNLSILRKNPAPNTFVGSVVR